MNIHAMFMAIYTHVMGSLVAQMVKNLPAMQESQGSIPGLEKSPREGSGFPLQYSYLAGSGQRNLAG